MMPPAHIYPQVADLPFVTTTQMIEVDRRMIEDIGISLLQMMENAGLQLANVARDVFLGGTAKDKRIAVLAGTGGNAGGAIVAARRLTMWGAQCDIGLGKTAGDLAAVPSAQFDILRTITTINPISPTDLGNGYDLILDGLIGYSLKGNPYGKVADYIQSANAVSSPVLSLDVPSGFDGATGKVRLPCVNADATLTLALPKLGMTRGEHVNNVGRLFCADISCPPQVFENLNLDRPYETPFTTSPVVEVL
jgi:NAD(P)H-hydrate epimerase